MFLKWGWIKWEKVFIKMLGAVFQNSLILGLFTTSTYRIFYVLRELTCVEESILRNSILPQFYYDIQLQWSRERISKDSCDAWGHKNRERKRTTFSRNIKILSRLIKMTHPKPASSEFHNGILTKLITINNIFSPRVTDKMITRDPKPKS